jgi:hypothetical protein
VENKIKERLSRAYMMQVLVGPNMVDLWQLVALVEVGVVVAVDRAVVVVRGEGGGGRRHC